MNNDKDIHGTYIVRRSRGIVVITRDVIVIDENGDVEIHTIRGEDIEETLRNVRKDVADIIREALGKNGNAN